ncbi:PR domain zinc finger protein 16 [Porphyridium purpureum]|uniref:PR domain zinc finger protein 16 n=1 Tax=Porphyridium purpureum TaxID=35688 RepID=A0A5J4Z3I9_PORPP|nr:PR domain zinc finger protein 16 [Porphyridium purpureum]|eukprot:POR2301..scf295_1
MVGMVEVDVADMAAEGAGMQEEPEHAQPKQVRDTSSMEQFLDMVLDISVLRAFLFDGVTSTGPGVFVGPSISKGIPMMKPVALELSVPVVSAQQVAELRASLGHRAKHFGFSIANPVQTDCAVATPLAPDTKSNTHRKEVRRDPGFTYGKCSSDMDEEDSGPDLVVSQSLSQEILQEIGLDSTSDLRLPDPLDTADAARIDSVRYPRADPASVLAPYQQPQKTVEGLSAVTMCTPSMVFGGWICAETFASNDEVCLGPFLAKLGIHDFERVNGRLVADTRRGSKLEYIEFSTGHSVLVYGLMGVATPLVIDFIAYKGRPSFLPDGGVMLGRTRMINMSECCECRTRNDQVCTCPRNELALGGVAHSNLFYETCEKELDRKFRDLIAKREQLPYDIEELQPWNMNALSILLAKLSNKIPEQCKTAWACNAYEKMASLSWFRVQNFSMKGRLWMEEYKMMVSNVHPVENVEADLFRVLFANSKTPGKFINSPMSDRALLLSDESESSASHKMELEEDPFVLRGRASNSLESLSFADTEPMSEELWIEAAAESDRHTFSMTTSGSEPGSHEISVFEGADLASLRCLMCDKNFTSRFNLKRHMQSVHSEARPFGCNQCDLAFKVRDHLQQHIRVSHGASRRHEFKCDRCDGTVTFLTRSNLLRHIRETHEKIMPHRCAECGKEFRSKFSLTRHVTMHTDVGQGVLSPSTSLGEGRHSTAPVA